MLEPRFVERGSFILIGAAAAGQLGEFNYGEIWEKQYKCTAGGFTPQVKSQIPAPSVSSIILPIAGQARYGWRSISRSSQKSLPQSNR